MNKSIVILGTSRSKGNTWQAIKMVYRDNISVIDLNNLTITPYDYENKNQDDEYIPLMEKLLSYDTIILATPVYWYTMSVPIKLFLDRLTDVITIRKDIGRKLKGKNLFVLASFGTSLPNGFEDAFSQTCTYMDMNYLGTSFIYFGEDKRLLAGNAEQIKFAQTRI